MKQEGFTRKESFAHERANSCCIFVCLYSVKLIRQDQRVPCTPRG